MTDFLRGYRTVPVVSLRSPAEAAPLAGALLAGGLPIAEVTLRTPDAMDGLREMAAIDGVVVGAGTVRTAVQFEAVIAAGATFVVSPCLTPELIEVSSSYDVPFLPGVVTPSEVQRAADAGLSTLKFFPAEASGGVRTLKALGEVFTDLRFMPTGGIDDRLVGDYLALGCVAAVGGSWMLPKALREAGDWDGVAAAVAACVEAVAR